MTGKSPMESSFRAGKTLPTESHSNSKIAKDAKNALITLKKKEAMDLVDMLGLTSYLEENKNG